MIEIYKCNLCKPDFRCETTPTGRTYFFDQVEEKEDCAEHIYDCPKFREVFGTRSVVTEQFTKLVNQETGEPYGSL